MHWLTHAGQHNSKGLPNRLLFVFVWFLNDVTPFRRVLWNTPSLQADTGDSVDVLVHVCTCHVHWRWMKGGPFFFVGFHVITVGVWVGGWAGEVWMVGMDARERVAVCTYLEPDRGKLLA